MWVIDGWLATPLILCRHYTFILYSLYSEYLLKGNLKLVNSNGVWRGPRFSLHASATSDANVFFVFATHVWLLPSLEMKIWLVDSLLCGRLWPVCQKYNWAAAMFVFHSCSFCWMILLAVKLKYLFGLVRFRNPCCNEYSCLPATVTTICTRKTFVHPYDNWMWVQRHRGISKTTTMMDSVAQVLSWVPPSTVLGWHPE